MLKPKLALSILILSCISLNIHAQSPDCKSFRNGTFKMDYPNLGTATIVRTWNVQRETITAKNMDLVFNIRWINDCSYTLMPTKETLNKYPSIPKNAIATVHITKTTKNSYTQTTTTNYSKEKTTGVVIKIK